MSYYSTNSLFQYTITNDTDYIMDTDDYNIINAAFNHWDELVIPDSRFNNNYTITVSFNIETLEDGNLGGASVQSAYYFGTYTFGNVFPQNGNLTLNKSYIETMKTDIREDGQSSYYHVIMHELGHI